MILLFQINPSASESALAVDHMRSFFECVLRDYYHHDVRTISAMMLERIADARQRGGGLSLPPESLFSLASRIAARSKCLPWQCPRSAPEPPQGAPGGPGRLEARRARGQATARPATALGARASLLQSCRSGTRPPPGRHSPTPAHPHGQNGLLYEGGWKSPPHSCIRPQCQNAHLHRTWEAHSTSSRRPVVGPSAPRQAHPPAPHLGRPI